MDEFKSRALKLNIIQKGYDVIDIIPVSDSIFSKGLYFVKTKVNGCHIYSCTNPECHIEKTNSLEASIASDIDSDIVELRSCMDKKFLLSEFIHNQLVYMLYFQKSKYAPYDHIMLNITANKLCKNFSSAEDFLTNFGSDDIDKLYEKLMKN